MLNYRKLDLEPPKPTEDEIPNLLDEPVVTVLAKCAIGVPISYEVSDETQKELDEIRVPKLISLALPARYYES